jgi:hypothetical protein
MTDHKTCPDTNRELSTNSRSDYKTPAEWKAIWLNKFDHNEINSRTNKCIAIAIDIAIERSYYKPWAY